MRGTDADQPPGGGVGLRNSLVVLYTLSQGSIIYAPADAAAGMVECLIGLAVVFLIFNPASSRHYRTSMRNTSSLA